MVISDSSDDAAGLPSGLRREALRCRLVDGRLCIASSGTGQIALDGIAPRVVLRSGPRRVEWVAAPLAEVEPGVFTAARTHPHVALILRCDETDDALRFRLEIENRSTAGLVIEELAPLHVGERGDVRVGAGSDRWSVWRNGFQSWSGTRSYSVDQADADPHFAFLRRTLTDARHASPGVAGMVRSDLVTAIKNLRSGEVLCAGFSGSAESFGSIHIDVRGQRLRRFTAACDFDGIRLESSGRLASEPLWLAGGFDEHDLLDAYATVLGREMNARFDERSPLGWCSWYYYFNRVTETHVLQNLAALADLKNEFPCDYVMVDDGWQRAVGDWYEWNQKFPQGMPWLAERIRADGLYAALWLAPFIARPEARLFRQHPDWFVRGAGGRPLRAVWNPMWGLRRSAYALDTTHPDVLDWLRDLAHTLVHDWGYQILKLDFLFAAALPGIRRDRNATRAQALRRGLEAIRAGAGDDAFLLGCGCPLGPAVGIVDGMRIGPDVAPFWRNWISRWLLRDRHGVATLNAVRNALTRSVFHRRLWLNDPDCLMVRTERTRLTSDEVQTLATVIGLSDGMLILSDRLDLLPGERRALVDRTRRLSGGRARALDLFEHDPPGLFLSEGPRGRYLGVFNFSSWPAAKLVDLRPYGREEGTVYEVHSGTLLDVNAGWVRLHDIPPHGCRLLRL